MKKLFIIGNAPDQENISELIQQNDCVVRFNHPSDDLLRKYGSKTDILFTINTWKFIQKRVQNHLNDEKWLNDCQEVKLAYHPSILKEFHHHPSLFSYLFKGKRIDGSALALDYFGPKFPVSYMSRQHYLDCCKLLQITQNDMSKYFPSTGFIAIYYFLKRHPNIHIYIHGFSWQGWEGHKWDAEKNIIQQWLKQNRLSWAKDLL